jgi:type IX secretion system PorP/SprF family membrane protein
MNTKNLHPMRKSIIITATIFLTATAFAQQIPLSSQYYTNMFVTNPAFTGTKENTNIFLTHRSQWIGIAGAPQTSYLTIDGPIEAKNIGLGMKIFSDATDITSRIGAFANYSYKLKIDDDNNVYIGLSAGVLNNRIDFSKVVVRDANDPMLYSESQSKTVFSADLGLGYTWKRLEVGFCVPQLLGNKIKYKANDTQNSYYTLSRHYQGTIKYTFDVIKEKEITAYPLIMIRAVKGAPVQYDVNAVLDWKKYGWVGITYHSNDAVAASIGFRYKNLGLGYAYDFGVSKVRKYLGSTSEFLLSYTFGEKKEVPPPVAMEQPKDSLAQALIASLQAKTDASQAEIDKLNAEMAKLKKDNETKPNTTLTENLMRNAAADDFSDESGGSMYKGYYVVIGTFSNLDNATKFKNANVLKGYTNARIYQNKGSKVFNVFVVKTEDKANALAELKKYQAEYPDVWIQYLE